MALGSPAIPTLRTNKDGTTDPRSLQNALNAIAERLRQIEEALGAIPGGTNLLSALNTQVDGFVIKSGTQLFTRKLLTGDGVDIDDPTGVRGNPTIAVPFVADVLDAADGLVVKAGSSGITRTLIGGSGSGITIHNPDGVAGDPDFTVP